MAGNLIDPGSLRSLLRSMLPQGLLRLVCAASRETGPRRENLVHARRGLILKWRSLMGALLLLCAASTAAESSECGLASLKGAFGFSTSGAWRINRANGPAVFPHSNVLGVFRYDGAGNMKLDATVFFESGGNIIVSEIGTYSIDSKTCKGTITLGGNDRPTFAVIVVDTGNQVETLFLTRPQMAPFTQKKE